MNTVPAVLLVVALALTGCAAQPTAESTDSAPAGELLPEPTDAARTPAEACVDPELESTGMWINVAGAWLEAGTIGEGETVAILIHQASSNYCGWIEYAKVLAANGIQSIVINLCGTAPSKCGLEDHPVVTGGEAILAAAQLARDNGATRVVAVGASMGGTTVVYAAEHCSDDCVLDAAASLSGPLEYASIDTSSDAASITIPMYFAVAPSDSVATIDEYASFTADISEVTINGEVSGHGWDMLFDGPGAVSAVGATVQAFILG